MHLNIGVCDDEELQVKVNTSYINDVAAANSLDTTIHGFTTLSSLFDFLEKHKIDILFMDIDMGGKSGIKAATEMFTKYPDLLVIFITGHREFAYEAFDMDALGYLLKPIVPAKLEHTLLKAIEQLKTRREKAETKYLIFYDDKNKVRVSVSEILFIERIRSHVQITTAKTQYRVYDSIKKFAERLEDDFVQINQSELINKDEIENIKGYTLYTKHCGEKVISRKYRKEVLDAFFHI